MIEILILILLQVATLSAVNVANKEEGINLKKLQNSRGSIGDFIKKLDRDLTKHDQQEQERTSQDSQQLPTALLQTKEWVEELDKSQLSNEIFAIQDQKTNVKMNATSKNHTIAFYIFVTLEIKEKALKAYIEDAARFGGVVVIRGFKGNMTSTASYIQKLVKNKNEGVIIDPTLFRKYHIDKVPAFVLAPRCDGFGCANNYDILRGNVTAHFALAQIKAKGDFKQEAEVLLK